MAAKSNSTTAGVFSLAFWQLKNLINLGHAPQIHQHYCMHLCSADEGRARGGAHEAITHQTSRSPIPHADKKGLCQRDYYTLISRIVRKISIQNPNRRRCTRKFPPCVKKWSQKDEWIGPLLILGKVLTFFKKLFPFFSF